MESKKPKQKHILFYGLNIVAIDHEGIKDLLIVQLNNISTKYPSQSDEINSIIAYIKQDSNDKSQYKWSFPKTFHVTTLFKERKGFNQTKAAFLTFKEGKEVEISITGLVYIPNKIVTFLVITNESVDNKFPHLTALVSGYKPKHSNDVCCALFGKNMPYEKHIQQISLNNQEQFIDEFTHLIFNAKETGYINIFKEVYKVKAQMTGFS